MNKSSSDTHYWGQIFSQFKQHTIGFTAACLFVIFSLLAVYAPFFASSKPLLVIYDGNIYFPLFRYLFYQGFYTKNLDLFYNLFMFTLPLYFLLKIFMRSSFYRLFICILVQVVVFIYLISVERLDPQGDPLLNIKRQNDNRL